MTSEGDVAIFWDYENCHASSTLTGYELVKKIRSVAHSLGTIKLFKAYLELSDPATFSKTLALRSELQSSGVSLIDCPHNGRKDVADKMMLVDMLAHAIDIAAPSTIILISGDRDFAYAVSILRLRHYRVVIISLPGIHASLKAQASIFLDWNADVLGVLISEESLPSSSSSECHSEERIVSASTYYSPALPKMADICSVSSVAKRVYALNDKSNPVDYSHRGSHGIPKSNDLKMPMAPDMAERLPQNVARNFRSQATKPHIDAQSSTETRFPAIPNDEGATPKSVTMHATPDLVYEEADASTVLLSDSTSELSLCRTMPATEQLSQGCDFPELPTSMSPHSLDTDTEPFSRRSCSSPAVSSGSEFPVPQSNSAPKCSSESPENIVSPTILLKEPTTSASVPPLVPPVFTLLVQRLEHHRQKGESRPLRSKLGAELLTQDSQLYNRAGVIGFGQYVAVAQRAGIVELGGKDGSAWIHLRPKWHNARLL